MKIEVKRYTPEDKCCWDEFVGRSKNGTFLFMRDYMDYHADRFVDFSLIVGNENDNIIALVPANISGSCIYSHQGLTYGGIVLGYGVTTSDVLEIFKSLVSFLRANGITEWHYKVIPTIYHRIPSQEDEYALWRMGAQLESCNISSACFLGREDRIVKNDRRRDFRRLSREGYILDFDADFSEYWKLLQTRLHIKYGAQPVHTLEEILRLKKSFPENILCCVAKNPDGKMECGAVLYLCEGVCHLQYCAVLGGGEKSRSMVFLLYGLVQHFLGEENYDCIDFGTSNEQEGKVLNEGLERWKASFGGRGVAYKTYKLML